MKKKIYDPARGDGAVEFVRLRQLAPTAPNKAVSICHCDLHDRFPVLQHGLPPFLSFGLTLPLPRRSRQGGLSLLSLTHALNRRWSGTVACIVVGWSVASVVVACGRVILRLAGLDGVLGLEQHVQALDVLAGAEVRSLIGTRARQSDLERPEAVELHAL